MIPIDDPGEDGFDISFTKEKKKGQSFWEYVGVQVDRKPSPLSDDEDQVTEWLDYIQENPIPDLLITSDYDHIKETFGGEITESKAMKQKRKEANDDEEKKTVVKKKEKIAEEEEAEEAPKRKKKIDTNELTYDEIQNMDEDALTKLIEDKDIDQPEEGFEDLDEAKSFVCEELQLSPPKKKKKVVEEEAEEVEEVEEKEPKKKLNWKDKLAKYKK